MNLKQLTKQKRAEYPKRMPTLGRIKIGRWLAVYASLPLFSAWAYLFAVPMMLSVSPTMWAKDKMRWFREGRRLR